MFLTHKCINFIDFIEVLVTPRRVGPTEIQDEQYEFCRLSKHPPLKIEVISNRSEFADKNQSDF